MDKWDKLKEWIEFKMEELENEMEDCEERGLEALREKAYCYLRAFKRTHEKMEKLEE